jgi:hypothetical protein
MTTTEGQVTMVQGRIVWTSGDLFKGKTKLDMNTGQPKLNKLNEQITEYGFGLAIPKSVLNDSATGQAGHIWRVLHEEAQKLYPQGIPPGFAMKYKDGDGVDHNGAPFSQREGYAGHIVLTCTTTLPIKFFRWENGQNIMINEGIKCGDYVNVQVQVKAHSAVGTSKPGLYVNPLAVQFLGYGKEIVNTPSGDTIFGVDQPPIPQGASQTPIAPSGMIVPNTPSTPAAPSFPQGPQTSPQMGQPMPSPAAPTAPAAPPMPNPTPTQPHYGVLPPAHQPQQMGQQAPAMPSFPSVPNFQGQ